MSHFVKTQAKVPNSGVAAPTSTYFPTRPFGTEVESAHNLDQTQAPAKPASRGHSFGAVSVAPRTPLIVQPKLKLGPVRDKYEEEADRVAQQVVSGVSTHTLRRPSDTIMRRKPAIQQMSALSTAPMVLPGVEADIEAERGSGQPLSTDVREQMEQGFGVNFGSVRIHTDVQSNQLNQSIAASAFTTGTDVFFAHGAYNPHGVEGQRLLAHELTHVIQQGGSNTDMPSGGSALLQRKIKLKIGEKLLTDLYEIQKELKIEGSEEKLTKEYAALILLHTISESEEEYKDVESLRQSLSKISQKLANATGFLDEFSDVIMNEEVKPATKTEKSKPKQKERKAKEPSSRTNLAPPTGLNAIFASAGFTEKAQPSTLPVMPTLVSTPVILLSRTMSHAQAHTSLRQLASRNVPQTWTLQETYVSNTDAQNDSYGGEYHLDDGTTNRANWVIHVHRSKKNKLTKAHVKARDAFSQDTGFDLGIPEAQKVGIPKLDDSSGINFKVREKGKAGYSTYKGTQAQAKLKEYVDGKLEIY